MYICTLIGLAIQVKDGSLDIISNHRPSVSGRYTLEVMVYILLYTCTLNGLAMQGRGFLCTINRFIKVIVYSLYKDRIDHHAKCKT